MVEGQVYLVPPATMLPPEETPGGICRGLVQIIAHVPGPDPCVPDEVKVPLNPALVAPETVKVVPNETADGFVVVK